MATDEIKDYQFVGLASGIVYLVSRTNRLKQIVLDNKHGGLSYLACLSLLQKDIASIASMLEDTMSIRTGWVNGSNSLRCNNLLIGDAYFRKELAKCDILLNTYESEVTIDGD